MAAANQADNKDLTVKQFDLGGVKSATSWNHFLAQKFELCNIKQKAELIKAYWVNRNDKTLSLAQIIELDMVNHHLIKNLMVHVFNNEQSDTIDYIIYGILSQGEAKYNEMMARHLTDTDTAIDELEHLEDEDAGSFIFDLYDSIGFDPIEESRKLG